MDVLVGVSVAAGVLVWVIVGVGVTVLVGLAGGVGVGDDVIDGVGVGVINIGISSTQSAVSIIFTKKSAVAYVSSTTNWYGNTPTVAIYVQLPPPLSQTNISTGVFPVTDCMLTVIGIYTVVAPEIIQPKLSMIFNK